MRRLVAVEGWTVIQDGFDPARNRVYESLFSLGNGHFGGRGTHEERYSGDSLRGNYLAGVYYPDPTRVGWWKNGYPEYFAKIVNAADWTPIHVMVDGEPLDLATAEILAFRRVLRMRQGELGRSFRARLAGGATVEVEALRFASMARHHLGAIRYRITPIDAAALTLSIQVDGEVANEDAHDPGGFWDEVSRRVDGARGLVVARTRKTGFVAGTAMAFEVTCGGEPVSAQPRSEERERFVAAVTDLDVRAGSTVEIVKFGANATSRQVEPDTIADRCWTELDFAQAAGFDGLRAQHHAAWERRWEHADVVIGGDPAVQQGIRFNIFGLLSTFTGDDPDLNIGPKGFTGEKYGGVTYWDTEAFCLPFYLATSEPGVAKNLLRYRYRQLDKAIANAAKLGFGDGAALYPMVTINGEECHNEWEITFEEIHRNGAIAFAVCNYIRHTGDERYLLEGGLEVLIAISRFWVQRVSFSEPKQAWVLLGVTGPNEYENNVDNNWYTNLMAQWTLRYTAAAIDRARELDPGGAAELLERVGFDPAAEPTRWSDVADRIWLPADQERGVFLQQDNYLDKEQLTVDDLDPAQRPLNQNWSWDRILRSCFIKQADVLQGLWTLEDQFDLDTLRRNFEFYEPRTVHESSLSPSVHAILAARLGLAGKAHEMLVRTARLDLDDYNNDTEDGLHITSMAGGWLAAVAGFGGFRVEDGRPSINPVLAPGWTTLQFRLRFHHALLAVETNQAGVTVENLADRPVELTVAGHPCTIESGRPLRFDRPSGTAL
jgi:maltose phosphorylase